MAGFSDYAEPKILDVLFNNTAFGAVAAVYIKLHTGDPGDAGANNAATETTRKSVSFAAASGGSIASDAQIQWTNIAGSQDATHFSLWDDVSAGNCLFTGTITANAYTAGDTFTIASGDLVLTCD